MNWSDYKPYNYANCSQCPLVNEPGPCMGEGDPNNAKLIYISEKPGPEECRERPMRPFVGPAGRVLNRQLTEAGIRRTNLYITNLVKCMPPGGREPTPGECDCCAPLLERELQRVRADTVLLAGAVAFSTLIGRYSTIHPNYQPSDSLFERLGCVEQRDGRKWIATIHPAFLMRLTNTPFKQEAIDHLRKAYAISGVAIPLPVVLTEPGNADIARHQNAAYSNRLFADDIEAIGYTEGTTEDEYVGDTQYRMDICGFSAVPYEAIVLDRARLADAWTDIWASSDIIQCEHNGESDRFHLEQIAPQLNTRFDTMYAHHMLHSNMYKYLKPEVLRTYTNLPYYNRDLEKVNRKLYNGMDCITTLLAARRQMALMKADTYTERDGTVVKGRLWDLYWGTAFPGEPGLGGILPLFEEQRTFGCNTDSKRTLLMYKIVQKRYKAAHAAITAMLGPLFNWQSYAAGGDVQNLFYERWKLPKQYKKNKNKDGHGYTQRVTCDANAREDLRTWINCSDIRRMQYEEAAEYFNLADEAGEAQKQLEFLDRVSPDGRIHTYWKAHGEELFRPASTPNLQNFPSDPVVRACPQCMQAWGPNSSPENGKCPRCQLELLEAPSPRAIVVADNPEEDVLLSWDLNVAELYTYAWIFGMKFVQKVYETGEYIYGVYFEDLLGKSYFENVPPGQPRTKQYIRKDMTYRELRESKMGVLGQMYGRQAAAIAAQYKIPVKEVEYCCGTWLKHNPEMVTGHAWIKYQMQQKGFLRPPPGWLVHCPAPDLKGLAAFGQAPAAYFLLTTMMKIDKEVKRQGLANTRIVLSVHDSCLHNIGGGKKDPRLVQHIYNNIISPVLSRPCVWLDNFCYRHNAEVGDAWDWQMTKVSKWLAQQGL